MCPVFVLYYVVFKKNGEMFEISKKIYCDNIVCVCVNEHMCECVCVCVCVQCGVYHQNIQSISNIQVLKSGISNKFTQCTQC